jgi:hypothetical protein
MTKVVRPFHQIAQAFLNERFRFGVETGGRFVQNQNARIGEDRPSDGHALPLAARQFYAAFADDGFVACAREALGELIDARDAAGLHDLFFTGVRPREGDVFFEWSRRTGRCPEAPLPSWLR